MTDYSVGKYLGELADLARPLLRTLWTDVLAPSRLRERRRRQYACAALTGQMVAQPSHVDPKDSFQEAGTDNVLTRAQIVARRAFMYADAMIDEEERDGPC